jgi:oligogalacturonide lyase
MRRLITVVLLLAPFAWAAEEPPPAEWIDSATGHRVIRLSKEPGSASLYFHQNAYSPDGKLLLITTPHGLATVNLATREVSTLVESGESRVTPLVVGRKSGDAYYIRDGQVFATNMETRATRSLAKLPERGRVGTLNADETLVAGAVAETAEPRVRGKQSRRTGDTITTSAPSSVPPATRNVDRAQQKELSLDERLNRRIPMSLLAMNVETGQTNTFNPCTDWLNHFQFAPTDPGLLMFCHEGPWHKVDRIWTIRTDGSQLRKIHARTMNMEIAGHEFWSGDGKTVWYDLQTPRGEDFWVAGVNLETGSRTWYHLERDEWSVHFNVSHDGTLFAGDGGDQHMVAHAKNGTWIYLFRPQLLPDVAGISADNKAELIQSGVFRSERLVDMSKHDYGLEPNVTFTPDNKYLIFRSNMFGPTHVFAVEVEKAH